MSDFYVKDDDELEFVIQEAKRYFEGSKPTHDWHHVLRVYNLSQHIGRKEGADMRILAFAAYLHDVGRCYEEEDISICHAEKGCEIARGIMERIGMPKDFMEPVLHCILTHRFRNNNVPETIEAKVLYDADKLDAIGAIGVARAYSYAGEHNQMLISDFEHDYDSDLHVDHSNHSPIKEYKVKLSKIRDKMLTDEGRRIAIDRDGFMKDYFERLKRECEGEI